MAKMNIRSSDLTTCESLSNAMMALMPAIGDAAHADNPFALYELMRLWLRMDTLLKRTQRRISREIDVAFDSMVAE